MKFEALALCEPILRSLKAVGYDEATPIQSRAIPEILNGRDMIGCAQTGTGKTAAFALPTLQRLMKPSAAVTGAERRRERSGRRVIRSLILAPTRELAGQIGESIATYGKFTGLRHAVIFGGVRQGPQVRLLQAGVDILAATPGRLLDLVGQGYIDLAAVEVLILDEADQMLDMGFIHDLRKIVAKCPDKRQTLMFSATMPKAIRELSRQWLNRPFQLEVAPVASTPDRVAQSVYLVERQHKAATLTRLLNETDRKKTLVFSRTKRGADKIARCLERDGIRAVAIHGNKSQSKRDAVIRQFKSDRPPVLVATDLAARGLDFSDISHVINYDMPECPETYVHRIGRTARAGASGKAVSFCGSDERQRLKSIERLIGQTVAVATMSGHPKYSKPAATQRPANKPAQGQKPARRPKRTGGAAGSLDSDGRPKRRVRRKTRSQASGATASVSSGASNTSQSQRKRRPRVTSGKSSAK